MAELKQKQKFEQNWKRFVELTGTTTPEKVIKLEQNEVVGLFKQVAEERFKLVQDKFKVKLSAILDAKIALEKSLNAGRAELAKKEEKEYETLNKELQDAFEVLNNGKKDSTTLVNEAAGNFTTEEPEDK
jgi:hypothetical protein